MTRAELLAELRAVAGRLADDATKKTLADAAVMGYLVDPEITDAWIAAGGTAGRHAAKQSPAPFFAGPLGGRRSLT